MTPLQTVDIRAIPEAEVHRIQTRELLGELLHGVNDVFSFGHDLTN